MILYPSVLALLLGSFLTLFILLYANWYGIRILQSWNLQSGSEFQLGLERRTYLISTIMTYALIFQVLSLFLFIYTADHLSALFSGAMCAAGTLNVNQWGYPTLLLKIVNFLAACVWLVINSTDNSAYDYPLIKKKYALLLPVTASITLETAFQTSYFLGLKPEVITSCCGTLFSSATTEDSSFALSSSRTAAILFYSAICITLLSGLFFLVKKKGVLVFTLSNLLLVPVSILALISYISPYLYELPSHHCPFCILHEEYVFIGYPLFLSFLIGSASGLGVGAISPFARIESLRETIPRIRKELTLVSVLSWTIALAISTWGVVSSNLIMDY